MNRNITAIILIVLAIGTYATFTRGKLAEISEVNKVNDQYITALKNADELIKVRDMVLSQDKAVSDNDRARLDKMLPNTVDNIRLIIDLNGIAMRHGFTLRNIKASAANNKGGNSAPSSAPSVPQAINAPTMVSIPTPILDTVSVSFSVTAPYQQFIDLLRDLEANLRVMDVTRLSVSASQTVNGSYDFNVELKTYWLRQQ